MRLIMIGILLTCLMGTKNVNGTSDLKRIITQIINAKKNSYELNKQIEIFRKKNLFTPYLTKESRQNILNNIESLKNHIESLNSNEIKDLYSYITYLNLNLNLTECQSLLDEDKNEYDRHKDNIKNNTSNIDYSKKALNQRNKDLKEYALGIIKDKNSKQKDKLIARITLLISYLGENKSVLKGNKDKNNFKREIKEIAKIRDDQDDIKVEDMIFLINEKFSKLLGIQLNYPENSEIVENIYKIWPRRPNQDDELKWLNSSDNL